jgi:hypothetical protein
MFNTNDPAAKASILVQIEFGEGDSLLPDVAFHNNAPSTSESLTGRQQQQGRDPRAPENTILAPEETTTMIVRNPKHIDWLRQSHQADMELKVRQLRRIPKYKDYNCVPDLAAHCRRMWHRTDDIIVKEGDLAEHVHYVIAGKVAVVKNFGGSDEQQLDVITRGSCIGDWGVVNEKLRSASCVTLSEVEVLMIRGSDFQALAGEDLLAEITDGDAGGGGGFVSEEGDGGKEAAAAVDEQGDDKDVTKTETLCYDQGGSFKLISRHEKKRAGAAMLKATVEMSQEDRILGMSALATSLAA